MTAYTDVVFSSVGLSVFFSIYKFAKGASTSFCLDLDGFFDEDFTGSGVLRFFIAF